MTDKPCVCLAGVECGRHSALEQLVMALAACQGALQGFSRKADFLPDLAAYCGELARAADGALRRIGSIA